MLLTGALPRLRRHTPDGSLLSLSISVGVAHLPHHSGGVRTLYTAADAALHEAKRAGQGGVVVACA